MQIGDAALALEAQFRSACSDYLASKLLMIGVTVGAALTVVILNVVLKGVLN